MLEAALRIDRRTGHSKGIADACLYMACLARAGDWHWSAAPGGRSERRLSGAQLEEALVGKGFCRGAMSVNSVLQGTLNSKNISDKGLCGGLRRRHRFRRHVYAEAKC